MKKAKSLIVLAAVLVVIVLISFLAVNGMQIGKYIFMSVADKVNMGLDLGGGTYAVYQAKDASGEDFDAQMQKTADIFRERLSAEADYTEGTVSIQGTDKIRLEIPNLPEAQAILDFVGANCKLEFKDPEGNTILQGEDVKSVRMVRPDATSNEYMIAFELTENGTKLFADATEANIGKNISIVLDNAIVASPTVQDAIPDGQVVITMGNDHVSARRLTSLIQSGELPVELEKIEESTLSASLGAEAMNSLVKSALIVILLLIVLMLVVYRLPGIAASLSLVVYVLLVAYAFALTGVQITLLSMASALVGGIMMVAGNVIILERFRDALKEGLKDKSALKIAARVGGKNAIGTIMDVNAMVLIASLMLIWLGSGPVRIFASSLFVTSLISMFTAAVITRILLKQVAGLGIKNTAWYTR